MLAEARVGTIGFAHREWIGRVYPSEATPGQLLPMYAQRLAGVELTTLSAELAETWAGTVPPSFQFAVKAPSRVAAELTSSRGAQRTMLGFFELATSLGDALGPILVQVPETRHADPRALGAFLSAMPEGLRFAFELRHPTWREDATLRVLSRHEAALVLTDDGQGIPRVELTAGFTYVRIRREDPEAVDEWAERLGDLVRRGVDVYAFLRHDRRGLAVDRAMRLASLLRAESQVGEQAMLS